MESDIKNEMRQTSFQTLPEIMDQLCFLALLKKHL